MMYGGDFVYRIMLYILGLFIIPPVTFMFTVLPFYVLGFTGIGLIAWMVISLVLYVIHVKWTKVVLPN